ncbi:D-alanyl-D-alanine carboxypeptidase [Clostridium pasteurianum DSM 525 = ATCC 6013]|uniref:D-alanyl-D-alanine carboxypeptidase n=1 Tax=Clostridium pasteurianum DSM 525 = ATCC 6013 TaxID=1262449 RepID=A0A0H3J3A9_CLOPA|nr:M15 family metallopeptidase [Clostridium pasteurianum]AJA47297.1 D-alanyl-D-alanine carboxypeptidase [Clostridium pasteurianum DSM 525 = ATCC 6013]AJA51285.1 D-alanyl-D-alanine carboxypeptidase [Clostridium pasteurianum DSM 525 = ATCC 6013]AOZ74638.1 glycoside hydrolase [Clostridium pasteurianum DSM 525 = ATCC 6013]AOZ78435.1 glycoside hydrolase [Clostridium pasteurianum]ELP57504.1 hypothetical protein F502_19166 [Clostridium pasteurianum DSM 525 = ATCC 6013]
MKKIIIILITILVVFSMGCNTKALNKISEDDNYNRTMKQDLLVLMMSYPEYVDNIAKDENENVCIVMKSGKKIIYDDKREKNHEEKLNNPDLQDMLEQIYPLGTVTKLMDTNFDPGRSRVYALTGEVYGNSRGKIEKNLMMVHTNYGSFQFNKNNNAGESLGNAFKELSERAKENRKISGFLSPCSGTFNYRIIAGTGRLSPHAFGTAIDLASDRRDYWKWATREQGETRLLSYSKDVVEVFEKNNFVWGGKWGHFDILHFEYRPEIILKAKYFGDKQESDKPWYAGVPLEEENIKNSIEKIENALK